MSVIKEFKDFAVKGNAVDLAVGVVIGTAFGAITNSLVKDIINPPLGLLAGKTGFAEKTLVLREATETAGIIAINYGVFISTLINFLIIAFTLFLVVKAMNKLRKQMESDESPNETKPDPPKDIQLLTEIRDLLKK